MDEVHVGARGRGLGALQLGQEVEAHPVELETIRGGREIVLRGRSLGARRGSQALLEALDLLLVGLDRSLDLRALAGECVRLARLLSGRALSATGEERGLSAS